MIEVDTANNNEIVVSEIHLHEGDTINSKTLTTCDKIQIFPIQLGVSVSFHSSKWRVSYLTYDVVSQAADKNSEFKPSLKSFTTKLGAEVFANDMRKLLKIEKMQCVKQGGISVSVDWLSKMVRSSRVDKFIRIAKSLESIEDQTKPITLPLDPYFLGLWLGDGTSAKDCITTMDREIVDYIQLWATTFPGKWAWIPSDKRGLASTYTMRDEMFPQTGKPHIRSNKKRKAFFELMQTKSFLSNAAIAKIISVCDETIKKWREQLVILGDSFLLFTANPVYAKLNEMNLINNKHIPEIYFHSDKISRLKLLAGLLDTDGCLKNNVYQITQKSIQLAKDIHRLTNELGFFVFRKTKMATCTNGTSQESKTGIPVERMSIFGLNLDDIPCLLPRKQFKPTEKTNYYLPKIKFSDVLPTETVAKRQKLG
jgi:hypothetical protein